MLISEYIFGNNPLVGFVAYFIKSAIPFGGPMIYLLKMIST